jgi:VWFA-related protein
MKRSICPLALVTISALPLLAFAQQPAAPPAASQAPSAAATVDEVVLDIVIRDKKGKPIADIKPEELTVLDDGAKQQLTSFRLVRGKDAIAPGGAITVLDPMRQLRLVTLAFEPPSTDPGAAAQPASDDRRPANRGSSELDQQKLARTAAIDLVKGDQGANVFYSVVVINRRLMVLQPFTNDRDAVVAAVNRATAGLASVKLAAESDAIKAQLRRTLGDAAPEAGALAAAANAAKESPASGAVSDRTRAVLAKVMLDMLRMDAAMAGIDARLSISALQSLVGGLQAMPGHRRPPLHLRAPVPCRRPAGDARPQIRSVLQHGHDRAAGTECAVPELGGHGQPRQRLFLRG